MNKFIGVGRLTKDGELRTTESGINIYNNSLAMKNNYKNKDGEYDSEFINIVAYRATADYLNKYASKGILIEIEAKVHSRSYEDKDGNKKYITEFVIDSANILERKKEDSQDATIPQNIKTDYDDSDVSLSDDDLPF